jgi:hypothetical protein
MFSREIYIAKDMQTARARKDETMEFLLLNAPKAGDLLDDAFDGITLSFHFLCLS